MSAILTAVVQILVPLVLAADLAFVRRANRAMWLSQVVLAAVATVLVLAISRWDQLGAYLLVGIPFLLAAAAARGYRRISIRARPTGKASVILTALLIVALGAADARLFVAYVTPAGAVNLTVPFAGGAYYVGGGGNTRWINNHQNDNPQRFAIDVLKLNAWGRASAGTSPRSLDAYASFGEPVRSPCRGIVTVAEDGHPDLVPPERDPDSRAGNHVVIACSGIKVLLAHLRLGSIAVEPGSAVEAGSLLGEVGNSGNTSQPHLHIHAERGGSDTSILENDPVPIVFDGRFLVRNSIVFP